MDTRRIKRREKAWGAELWPKKQTAKTEMEWELETKKERKRTRETTTEAQSPQSPLLLMLEGCGVGNLAQHPAAQPPHIYIQSGKKLQLTTSQWCVCSCSQAQKRFAAWVCQNSLLITSVFVLPNSNLPTLFPSSSLFNPRTSLHILHKQWLGLGRLIFQLIHLVIFPCSLWV